MQELKEGITLFTLSDPMVQRCGQRTALTSQIGSRIPSLLPTDHHVSMTL